MHACLMQMMVVRWPNLQHLVYPLLLHAAECGVSLHSGKHAHWGLRAHDGAHTAQDASGSCDPITCEDTTAATRPGHAASWHMPLPARLSARRKGLPLVRASSSAAIIYPTAWHASCAITAASAAPRMLPERLARPSQLLLQSLSGAPTILVQFCVARPSMDAQKSSCMAWSNANQAPPVPVLTKLESDLCGGRPRLMHAGTRRTRPRLLQASASGLPVPRGRGVLRLCPAPCTVEPCLAEAYSRGHHPMQPALRRASLGF